MRLPDLSNLTPSDWAAWSALIVSVVLAVLQGVNRTRSRRVAEPVAWLERAGDQAYCVVSNHGQADARQIGLEITTQGGEPVELRGSDHWLLPFAAVAGGDLVYLQYDHIPGRYPTVLAIHLTWHDDRGGTQSRRRCTSLRPVFVPPSITPASLRRSQ